jgi:hypothetical protein
MRLVLLLLVATCLTGCVPQFPFYCEDENAPICYLQRRPIFAPREKPTSVPKSERRDASCRTMRLGAPQPPSPPCTPARAIDDKGEPANSIQGILEALQGYRCLTHVNPSHGTDRLTDSLTSCCHERPSGGLWRRARPSTQNWAPCAGCFGGAVWGYSWPKGRGGVPQIQEDAGGRDVHPRFRFSTPPRQCRIDAGPAKKHASFDAYDNAISSARGRHSPLCPWCG